MRTSLKTLTTALVLVAGAVSLSACVADPYAYDNAYYGNGYGYSSPGYAYAPNYNNYYVAPRYTPPPRVIYRDHDRRDRRRHDHDHDRHS